MREFFKGWRRKIGVLTLVMACVFAAGWVRSVIVADSISWTSRKNALDLLMSAEQNLVWQTNYYVEDVQSMVLPRWHSSFLDYTIPDNADDEPLWRWRIAGFEAGEFTAEMSGDSSHGLFCSIPYWSIVFPLTLISAFLFLSKYGQSRQMKTAAIPPAVGT